MPLREYRKKRDFASTAEPRGGKSISRGLRFVVQKHDASHLHYDLRLEADGVLKSWAVPKGPSLRPEDKRLALMTEDHPLDYRKFEGTIPAGNYGAGEVIVWDEGTYIAPGAKSKKETEKSTLNGLKKGIVHFIVSGRKLRGEFVLAKIKSGEENAWLLMKKSDQFVSEKDVTQENRSVVSGRRLMNERRRSIDLKDGVRRAMPHQIKPMLARVSDRAFSRKGWIYEIKWDGYRAIAEINDGKVNLYSRNYKSFISDYPEIVRALKKLKGQAVLDGEIVVTDKNGKSSFQRLQQYRSEGRGKLSYYVFDILYLDGYDLTRLPLKKRKEILADFLPNSDQIKYSDHIEERGMEFFEAAKKQDLEGVMAKDSNSKYVPGVRTENWLKFKTEMRQEAVVAGYTEPRGSRKKFGSLILGVYEKGKLNYIGHTGTGFNEPTLDQVYKLLKKRIRPTSPFAHPPKTNAPAHWVHPDLVAEIKFAEWTSDRHIRKPVFVGLRNDKRPREIRIESNKLENQKTMHTKSKIVTNPEKIYWPEKGYTKGDLVRFYDRISSVILPYLKGRPESLNRHPDGIEGESFYQKDVDHRVPRWVKTIKLKSKSKNGGINYLICENKETLLYLANLGCIEINPWSSRVGNLDRPDFAIFDLDPGRTDDFENVILAALEIKKTLDTIGAKCYCKTSGKSGLHVYVPTAAKYTYGQVKQFCEIVAKLVHDRMPNETTTERMVNKRKKKIYIDYLQNRRGQTLAAPYSLRPTVNATVSTPLKWQEVRKGLRPEKFTMKNIFSRLNKTGDLWKPVIGKGIDMEKAVTKLRETY